MPDKILLIEDEEDLASIVAYNLQKEGFSVEIVASGAKGFELLEAKEFSLILLDLMLPDMSGIDICKKIQKSDKLKLYYPKEEIRHVLKQGSSKNNTLFFIHTFSAIKYFLKWGFR